MKTFNHPISTSIRPSTCWCLAAALALLAATAQAQTQFAVFTNVWSITNLTFTDLPASGDVVRGLALSPLTTNLVYASRGNPTPNHFATLDYTGTNRLGQSSSVGIASGTLALTQIRESDDGFVYACNLSGASNSTFKVYRWSSDTNFTDGATVVFNSTNFYFNPPGTNSFQYRIGDYMDLRGSGASTEIILSGNGVGGPVSTNVVLLRPTDAEATNFTPILITMPSPVPIPPGTNVAGGGITFEGANNVIYIKRPGLTTVTRVAYDPIGATATNMSSFLMDQGNNNGLEYFEIGGAKLIATVSAANGASTNSTTHFAKVLQLTTPSNAVVVLSAPLPLPVAANGNVLGLVDAKNEHVAFSEPNNGISLYKFTGFISNIPPSITISASASTVIEGLVNVTNTATITGTAPITNRWYFIANGVTNAVSVAATNAPSTYVLAPAQLANAGGYFVIANNNAGAVTSGVVNLTVLPATFTPYATNLWSLAPGSRPYLTTGDTQRGLAYDPVRNKLVLPSRSSTNGIHVLDAATGADENELDIGTILANPPAPGTFMFNQCGVADDGAVYVGNLITSGASDQFTIYRWADSTSSSTVGQAYLGNPGVTRLGDTMAVRGAAENTEILCSFRTGTNLALFLPNDGLGQTYGVNILTVTNLPDDAVANGFAGLGLAFGPGNTFWAKSSGFNLRLVAYDTNDMTAHVVATYTNLPTTEAPLGADNLNGYIATVGFGQTPQNLSLWDIARGEPVAFQLDRELFPTSNANLNGTGAVAVDPVNRRIFALDSNNGLIALSYSIYTLSIAPTLEGGIVTWLGTGNLQSAPVVTGPYTDIIGATTPYTNTTAGQIYFRVRR